ncbi:hypothetical protein [Microcystis sp.]|uniref:hypothetical protein n=1 Tax=Microcystis sp. TaxID=1127 RepID=UPI0039190631
MSSGDVNIKSAIILGGISGIIVLLGEEFLVKTKVIDNPVVVIPIHLFCVCWGTMAVGFFSTKGAEEFARGSAQDNWLSQVVFQFFSMDCSHGIYFYF